MMTSTTMNDSGFVNAAISKMVHQVAETAAVAVFEKGVGVLPPPTHTAFFLGCKQDRKLNVVMGEVKITSTSVPDKHVTLTLTTNHWMRLMSIHQQINIELEQFHHRTRLVAYCAHIGDRYYMSVTSRYNCVDIRRFYIPYGLPCGQVRPSRSGLVLRLDKWSHLL